MAGFLDPRLPASTRPSGIAIDENGDYYLLDGANDASIYELDDEYYLTPANGVDPEPSTEPAAKLVTTQGFDFSKSAPAFYTTLNLPASTVLQSFTINETTNQIYTTQVSSPNPDPSESFTIGRLTIDGTLLDSMTLTHGGHGTTIGLETVGADVYIWSNYDKVDAGKNTIGNDLVRFKYVPGATYTEASPELVRYNKFTTAYITPTTDQKNGTICFRLTSPAGVQSLQLRNLADVKNGVDKILGTIIIPDDVAYMQGTTYDGDYAYWYTGDTNAVAVPSSITRYRFSTGQQDRKVPASFGLSVDGVTYEDNFREPEGVNLYTDPETGLKTLFAGVVTGEGGRRIAKVYGFHEAGNSDKFTGYKTQAAQGYKLTRNNGYVKRLPIGLASLAALTDPGYYYATAAELATMTDAPWSTHGSWVFNSPREINGAIEQVVSRNSTTLTNRRTVARVVNLNSTAGAWENRFIGSPTWTPIATPAGVTVVNALQLTPAPGSGQKIDLAGLVNVPGTWTNGMTIGTVPAGFVPAASRRINLGVDDNLGGSVIVQIVATTGIIRLWSPPGAGKNIVFDGASYYL